MSKELDLKHYLSIIRKRLWLIMIFVIVVVSATGAVSYFMLKPVYQASAKLLVNSAAGNLGTIKLDLNMINSNISLINTYKEILRTPAMMDEVVAQNPDLGVTSEELMRKIRFHSVNGTQVFTLSYQDHDYSLAANAVNAVAEVFQSQIPVIMRVDNVHLLHMADPDKVPAPVKPNEKLNMAVSFVVALLFGIAAALALEYFDDRIRNEEDVEYYLGLPTLVMIPSIRQGDLKVKRRLAANSSKAGEASRVPIS
ncbi:LPS biosynthesis protein [Paenibacillus sp. 32O-W]|uniref:Capsular polysaccharide type 5/8 biosynthesis protein CapA n=1 Tax=Paenibacillus cisolokensis TaxID=1658519 RepID=A0ABQ4N2Z5_9BACL|nr:MULTISPECIES: Wzz/FepE/Etk N-terminal domain-containing protein [Paenibacillus]ALS26644.1 LPS biosynthesis protein [Paenibacillus sp. 32O-W]GIQ62552.1 capsular polysaccharide type 5/8 biosynthesis protein CapA [Paenibacillus cisolokensis]